MTNKFFKRPFLSFIFSLVFLAPTKSAFAINPEPSTRTIMVYICGANLESFDASATYNIH